MTRRAPSGSPDPSADPTRDRILAAAIDLFSERSFDGATTARHRRARRRHPAVAELPLPLEGRAVAGGGRRAVRHAERHHARAHATGYAGVDELTSAKLLVREFITFSARHPQLHRIITQESKADGPRMDYLVERHVRPLYEQHRRAVRAPGSRRCRARPSRRRTSTTSSPAPDRRCSCSHRSANG